MTHAESGRVVVIGMDGSAEATRAADYGAWEAKRRGVPLRLVFAHQPTPMWGPSILISDDYAWDRDWVRGILIRAEKQVTSAHPDITVQSAVVSGSAAYALVEESRQASLVVLGTRAGGGLMGHLSGFRSCAGRRARAHPGHRPARRRG